MTAIASGTAEVVPGRQAESCLACPSQGSGVSGTTAALLRSSGIGPTSIMASITSARVKPVSCAALTGAHRVHPRRNSHLCAAHPLQEASAPEVMAI